MERGISYDGRIGSLRIGDIDLLSAKSIVGDFTELPALKVLHLLVFRRIFVKLWI